MKIIQEEMCFLKEIYITKNLANMLTKAVAREKY